MAQSLDDIVNQVGAANGAAPSASSPTSYDDVVQQMSAEQASAVSIGNAGINPDQAARAQQLSQDLGVPAPTVEADMPTYEKQAQIAKNNAILAANPAVASWVNNNSPEAKMAQDEYDKLGTVSQALFNFGRGYTDATDTNEVGRLGSEMMLGINSPERQQKINQLQTEMNAPNPAGWFGSKLQSLSGFFGGMGDNLLQGALPGAVVGGVAGLPEGGIGAIPGALLGGGIGLKADMARISAGNTYLQLKQARDSAGNPLPIGAAEAGAIIAGVGTYAVAGMGTSHVADEAKAAFMQEAVTKMVSNPTTATALGDFAAQLGKSSLTFAGLNLGMEGSNILGDQIGRAIGDSPDVLNDPVQREQAMNRLVDSVENGLLLGPITGFLPAVGELNRGLVQARAAEYNNQAFTNLEQAAMDTKLPDRNAQAFQSFIASQTDGTPIENLYIPHEAVRELYQKHGIDPAKSDPFFSFVPDMQQQLAQTALNGGDIVIPTADYITNISRKPLGAELRNDIRTSPDAMTMRQSQEYKAGYAELLQSRIKSAMDGSAQPSAEDAQTKIMNDVQNQLAATGRFSDMDANKYSKLYAAHYTTRAARLGVDALDLYNSSAPKIISGGDGPIRMGKLTPDAPAAPAIPEPVAGKEAARPSNSSAYQMLKPSELTLDPKRFQYKASDDQGVPGALAGTSKWEPHLANPITAYRDEDGKMYVVNGHQRLNLAKRAEAAGQKDVEMPARVFDAKDGYTSDYMKTLGAYQNIAEGSGTAIDAAKILRGAHAIPEDRQLPGLPPKSQLVMQARGLAALSEDAFGMVVNDIVPAAYGAEVGRFITDPSQQLATMGILAKAKPSNLEQASFMVQDIKNSGFLSGEQQSLFGTEQNATSLFSERSRILEAAIKQLRQLKTAFGVAVEQEGALSGEGNVLSTESNVKAKARNESLIENLKQNATRKGDISDALTDAAKRLADGESAKSVTSDFLARTRELGLDASDGSLRSGADGSGDGDEAASGDGISEPIRQLFQGPDSTGSIDKSLLQAYRGSISLGPQKLIKLFEGADFSTLLHESAHAWLEEMKSDAQLEGSPDNVKTDWETIKKHFKIGADGIIPMESHENFARSMEQYFMEGKAPSEELRPAFASFKNWLVQIYRTVRNLNVNLTDEVREVFDRMLASDNEISETETIQKLRPLFTNAEQAGMTDAEFKAYGKLADDARYSSSQELTNKLMEGIRRQRTKEWISQFDAMRPDVETEVNARRDIKALHFLRKGSILDLPEGAEEPPRMKLSIKAVEADKPGWDAKDRLPDGVAVSRGGFAPDDIAPFVGYDDGRQMLNDLQRLGNQEEALKTRGIKQNLRDYIIDRETRQRLMAQHGDILSQDGIADDAMRALHNASRSELIAADVSALARRIGTQAIPRRIMKEWAEGVIGEKSVRDGTSVAVYQREEAKAGRATEEALRKGDMQEAFKQKQRQQFNHALYTAARDAADRSDSALKRMKYYAARDTIKSVNQAELDQIHALLEKVDLRQASQKDLARRESFANWVNEKLANGEEVVAPADMLEKISQTHYTKMKLDDFLDLDDAIKNIAHIGRQKQYYMDNQAKIARGNLRDEIKAQRRPGEKINTSTLYEQDQRKRGASWRRAPETLTKISASLTRTETVMQKLDNDKVDGPFQKYFFRPLSEAADKETVMQATEKQAWLNMQEMMPDGWHDFLDKKITTPELMDPRTNEPHEFSGAEILGMALNVGNDGNLGKMLRGEKWTEGALMTVLDREMGQEHWNLVKAIADRFASYWPETEKLYERLYGVAPKKVEVREVQTKYGKMEGWYYPLMYDPQRAAEMMVKRGGVELSESTPGNMNFSFLRAATDRGRTMERTDVAYPLLYDLNMIVPKISEAIHDLAFRESIINSNKFLDDPVIAGQIHDRAGMDAYRQLRAHVQDIASPYKNDASMEGLNRVMQLLRRNAVGVGILFRLSTIVKHFTSAGAQSFGELGPHWMLHGVRKFWSGPDTMIKDVYNKSSFMRLRMNQIDADIRSGQARLEGDRGITQAVHAIGHYGVGLSDQATAVPTWIGAYDKARSEGVGEQDAISRADGTVRNAHGAARSVDLPAFLRGNEFQRLFTPFYTFLNHMYNRGVLRTGREITYAREAMTEHDAATASKHFVAAAARTFWYFIVPGVLMNAVLNPKSDKKENWLAWAADNIGGELAGTVPFVRGVWDAVDQGQNTNFSPIGRVFDTAIQSAKDASAAIHGRQPSPQWLKHAMDTAGYLTGIPVGGQPAATGQFIYNVAKGADHPHGLQQYVHGIMYGSSKPKNK